MFSKNKVFEQMKKTGFVGAGIKAGKGKGKRHRWDLSKPGKLDNEKTEPLVHDMGREETAEGESIDRLNPNTADPGVLEDTPAKSAHHSVQIHVNLPGNLMGELKKMNPKRRIK